MSELLTAYNPKHYEPFAAAMAAGARKFDFMGGRRSGKSYFIEQFLLAQVLQGDVINVATMTDTQGRLGAYADVLDILNESPNGAQWFTITRNPKEVRCTANRGRMFFNSYQYGERAKGIACDWLWMNEANNFSEQQYIDLSASVRKGVICDRNPNSECFTERNGFTLLHSDWRFNADYLTAEQLAWFEQLKRKAEDPNATSADVAFYRMYYLGEYAEIYGEIFTPANIIREKIDPTRLYNFAIISDPSNLTGADYFASVCVATDGARMYVLDAWSQNTSAMPAEVTNWVEWCKRWNVVLDKWREWVARYNVQMLFCEANGVGAEFLRYARSEDWAVRPFSSTGNKHTRIKDNYNNLTSRVVFNDTESVSEYLSQVYAYTGKDEAGQHDDNVDCVSSAFDIFYKRTRMMQQ